MEGRGQGEEGGGERGGLSVFTTLGTTVLTSRPHEVPAKASHTSGACLDSHRASLQGEIFQSVTKEVGGERGGREGEGRGEGGEGGGGGRGGGEGGGGRGGKVCKCGVTCSTGGDSY